MMIIIIIIAIDGFIRTEKMSRPGIPQSIPVFGGMGVGSIALFLVLSGWTGYGIHVNQEEIRARNTSDYIYGYQSAVYSESDLIEFIKKFPPEVSIWGNFHKETIYFHDDARLNYSISPSNYWKLRYLAREESGYIFHSSFPDFPVDYTIYELSGIDGLDYVDELSDGIVFRISGRPHAEKYAAITSREPDIVSEFNVYLSGNELSFIREPCRRPEIQDTVYVHVIPRNVSNLPEKFRHSAIDNLDFRFRTAGVIFDGTCMATIPLPEYQITTIYTGVHASGPHFWRGQFHPSFNTFPDPAIIWSATLEPPLDMARLQEDYDAITSGTPVVQSFYSVWIDGPYISYTRDPCEPEDTTALFFLHVYPDDDADLPDEREPDVDFDNLDFVFEPATGSVRFDGKCIATRILPDYPIASLRTGQYDAQGDIWSVDIPR